MQDDKEREVPGKMQPEVDIGVDHLLFTWTMNPHNPRCIKEIFKHVSIGANLTAEQRSKVVDLLTEFADCFALSVSEVIPIPGAEHHIHCWTQDSQRKFPINDNSQRPNAHT